MSLKSCVCVLGVWAVCFWMGTPGALAEEGGQKKLRFSEVAKTAEADTQAFPASDEPGSSTMHVRKRAILTQDDVQSCQVQPENEGWRVLLTFNKAGTKKFHEASKRLQGQQIAIFIEDKIVSAPVLMAEIPDGVVVISGNFTEAEAQELAQGLERKAPDAAAVPKVPSK